MITRKQKTVLTCAVTGGVTTKENTPFLPCSPQEIATSALEAAEAGASVVHLHAREDDGKPSISLEKYRETVELIRKENDRVIINLTTGPGAKFIPDSTRLIAGRPESTMLPAGRRVSHVLQIKPDICSIDFNTMNESDQKRIRMNMPYVVREMLRAVQAAGGQPDDHARRTPHHCTAVPHPGSQPRRCARAAGRIADRGTEAARKARQEPA